MPDLLEVDVDLLIRLVEEHRILWDKNEEDYKNTKYTNAAWRDVCSTLIADFETVGENEKMEISKFVRKKWANLRDAWLKYLKKQRDVKRTKKYLYHDQMQFLTTIYGSASPYDTFTGEFTPKYELFEEAADLGSDASADMYSSTVGSTNDTSSSTYETAVQVKKCKIEEAEGRAPSEETTAPSDDNNRHMLFFRSILPSVVDFSEDQIIDFQMGILNVIKNIKRTKYSSTTASTSATDK
ncbi:unnamed protein product [Ceutorhynchus assimilis]|uniref:MADF domain-containing protein n=1 Tax=Ceutorhynchus assimilis TaxID=467358 RepID=A0A9N9MXS4_9CUCU|nr:unnamed protein product [Ceutorhynchus assimilis]